MYNCTANSSELFLSVLSDLEVLIVSFYRKKKKALSLSTDQ